MAQWPSSCYHGYFSVPSATDRDPWLMITGIKRTCFNEWCEIDKTYRARYDYKRQLYRDHPEDTVCYAPGSDEPCFEALHTLVEYLPRRYPSMFSKTSEGIKNMVTGDDWDLTEGADTWKTYHPLQVMGLLSTEDWFILQKIDAPDTASTPPTPAQLGNTYRLTAGANCFPAGWRLRERIGHTISELHHNKVPFYAERLALSMHRFFNRLRVDQPHMRFNYAVDISGELFHINSHHNLDVTTLDHPVRLDDLHLRVERQVLQRLPKTRAIAFSIRTYITPITEVTSDKAVARALRTNTRSYKPEVAIYKNKSLWERILEEHLDDVLGPEEAQDGRDRSGEQPPTQDQTQ
jgi:dimethylamine monooxygenase subunit A